MSGFVSGVSTREWGKEVLSSEVPVVVDFGPIGADRATR